MVAAQLLVERGSLRDRSEDWGRFDFLALPSPADRLAVERDGQTHYMTVLSVHHRPQPSAAAPPTAAVVAKWTGAARS